MRGLPRFWRAEATLRVSGTRGTASVFLSATAWVLAHVHPDFRRRGIVSALPVELEAVARAENKRQVLMYAHSALNEAVGFVPIGHHGVPKRELRLPAAPP